MTSPFPTTSLLAAAGGTPIRTRPFPPWPVFDEEQVAAVAAVLRSGKVNYWTGEETQEFEREFAQAAGCQYAVALANGTVALELALHAAGIGPGDEVIVTCRSFMASASCAISRGAIPVFADVDPESQNVTADTIRAVLSSRTRAIIAVHLAGWPCEMDPIMELAADHGLVVIEDCAQAHGATYRGRPVGSLGHVAAFSFCQDKILTTGGEGGMLTTNDPAIWEKAWSYKDHGKSWSAMHARQPGSGFKWVHESFGTNWRMTEMQAAIGRIVLRRLPDWVRTRRRNAAFLTERLCDQPALRVATPPSHLEHSYYKYYAFLRPAWLRADWSRDRFLAALQAEGIPCGSGICPEIYREKAFDGSPSCPEERLPAAQLLGETSLMLQVHPTLTEQDLADTCTAMEKVLAAATVAVAKPNRRVA
jgi:dTDP-4-amino-4,6-dideoxygalactose transaminase